MTVPIWMGQMFETAAEMGKNNLENLSKKPFSDSIEEMCQDLIHRHGEASGTALAKRIIEKYRSMSQTDKVDFLMMLLTKFAADPIIIKEAALKYVENQNTDTLKTLVRSTETPRMDLLRLLNTAPDGTSTIISMRELLLKEMKTRPELEALNFGMLRLLTPWFNRGFLQFQQIDWHTPAVILEKLIEYEAVHEIKGWDDLRRRLAKDRRCFAFFHPVLPNEPLIFVEVAFTKGIATKIKPLLGPLTPDDDSQIPDTAIFYSISNCQKGLQGISFGNFLIKQVVDSISTDMPTIKTFCTLSPIPNFNKWLQQVYLERETTIFSRQEMSVLSNPNWFDDDQNREKLRTKLMNLCAIYLSQEKKNYQPFDPVTRFHLKNGAEIENIGWEANLSKVGLEQSTGMMVNYLYNPSHIVTNHEAFVNDGQIATTSRFRKFLNS